MKRLALLLVGAALGAIALGPALATDGTHGNTGPALRDKDTRNVAPCGPYGCVYDSQSPPHVLVINSQTVTLTGHSTSTLTVTSTYTHTHTVTDVSGAMASTATHVHTMAMPNATKTVTNGGTMTMVSTDIGTTTPTAGKIPVAGVGATLDNGWLYSQHVVGVYHQINTSTATASSTWADVMSTVVTVHDLDVITVQGTLSALAPSSGSVCGCAARILIDSSDAYSIVTEASPFTNGSWVTTTPTAQLLAASAGTHTIKLQMLQDCGEATYYTTTPGHASLLTTWTSPVF